MRKTYAVAKRRGLPFDVWTRLLMVPLVLSISLAAQQWWVLVGLVVAVPLMIDIRRYWKLPTMVEIDDDGVTFSGFRDGRIERIAWADLYSVRLGGGLYTDGLVWRSPESVVASRADLDDASDLHLEISRRAPNLRSLWSPRKVTNRRD